MGGDDDDDKEDIEEQDETTINQHYGWLVTLYELAETSILSITGDKSITDINIVFAFNYLSLKNEIDKDKIRKIKQEQQKYGRIR